MAFNKEAIVVNKRLKKEYARKSFQVLLEKGLFRQALACALFDRNEEQQRVFAREYGKLIGNDLLTLEDVMKIFGLQDVPDVVKAVQLI